MKFNYNGLWKLLIDNNMKKKDLIDGTGISPTTVAKMIKVKLFPFLFCVKFVRN